MPHLRIEYSGNLETRLDVARFCTTLHTCIKNTGLFELGAIRVRAFRCDHLAVADLLAENSFLDMQFAVGEGRSANDLKRAGGQIFGSASDQLAQLFETPHFALSFQITEINGNLSWKKNAMHARLRNS